MHKQDKKCERERERENNKAVYTAALVADGWAGAEKVKKKQLCDQLTQLRTDGLKSVESRVRD